MLNKKNIDLVIDGFFNEPGASLKLNAYLADTGSMIYGQFLHCVDIGVMPARMDIIHDGAFIVDSWTEMCDMLSYDNKYDDCWKDTIMIESGKNDGKIVDVIRESVCRDVVAGNLYMHDLDKSDLDFPSSRELLIKYVECAALPFCRVFYDGLAASKMYDNNNCYMINTMESASKNYWFTYYDGYNKFEDHYEGLWLECDEARKHGFNVQFAPDKNAAEHLEIACSGLSLGTVVNHNDLLKLYRLLIGIFNTDVSDMILDYLVIMSTTAF